MFYTLSNLQDSIARRIQELGPDAPVAAFIFSQEDVHDALIDIDETVKDRDDYNQFVEDVMCDVGDCDYIYEQINETLEDSVKDRIRRRVQN